MDFSRELECFEFSRARVMHIRAHDMLAWRPRPFPHAKEERFSRRRAWYQPTKVMFLSTILLTMNFLCSYMYFDVAECIYCSEQAFEISSSKDTD